MNYAVYQHRNRCAHNTLSYQSNKPELDSLAEDDGINNNAYNHNHYMQ